MPHSMMKLMGLINQCHRLVMRSSQFTLPYGMTTSQISAISFLTYSGECDVYQRDLETCFRLRRSTLSSLLNTLEKKGLIVRVPVPQDARLKKLILTEKGREVGDSVDRFLTYAIQLMIRDLTEEELQTLRTIFKKIQHNLDTAE